MLVKTYKDGLSRTGLHIGEANAQRYFSRRRPSIELRLDDLHIQCTLTPDFWQGHPQIHDPRLSVWLRFKAGRERAVREPMHFTMVLSQAGTFILKPNTETKNQAFGADITRPRTVQSERLLTRASAPLRAARSVA